MFRRRYEPLPGPHIACDVAVGTPATAHRSVMLFMRVSGHNLASDMRGISSAG